MFMSFRKPLLHLTPAAFVIAQVQSKNTQDSYFQIEKIQELAAVFTIRAKVKRIFDY